MNKYLVLITIGPVQDFIASARKLRDLWFGSYLLSELSKTVARNLFSSTTKMIFPYVSSIDDLNADSPLIVGNKILAIVESETSPGQIIVSAKQAWIDHRFKIAQKTLTVMDKIPGLKFKRELFEKQALDAGEFFASWVSLNGDYIQAKMNVEKLLAGRKNLREFEAPLWRGESVPKNSLDGMRESVTGDDQEEIMGLIKKHERLDALGCIKRFNPLSKGKRFEDLTQIAFIPFYEGFGEKYHQLLTKYLSYFLQYAPEKLNEIKPEDHAEYFYYDSRDMEQHGALETFKFFLKVADAPPLPRYACILVGDGDDMGKTLDHIADEQGHSTFARHLSGFSSKVEQEIETYGGSLIYAGGDDIMAYVPLHRVVECSDRIRKLFSETMDIIFKDLHLSSDKPTFSIGVAVVHHSAPLDQALHTARRAEQIAKKEKGKNAFAIIQTRRGKENLIIKGKWESASQKGIVDRITAMCDLHKKGHLPSTLGFQLRQASIDAGNVLAFDFSDGIKPLNGASAVVLHILGRKEHSELLKDLLRDQKSVRTLSDELIVARQIAAVQQMSKGEKL